MCQLEKPRANEITAPPALTARKLELRGKAMVSQSRFRRTRFSCGQSWGKQKESDVLRKNNCKRRSQGRSEDWVNHEPLSLSARFFLLSGWNSSIFFFFGPGFALLFIQGLFSVLERFMPTKSRRFDLESVTTLECKQEMLMSWNRISRMNLPRKGDND